MFRSILRKKTRSQFCLLEQETFFLIRFLKTRQLKISKIASEKRRLLRYRQMILLNYFGCFVKLIFSHNYIPSFGIDSSEDLRMSSSSSE
jgi:hypothetical protein